MASALGWITLSGIAAAALGILCLPRRGALGEGPAPRRLIKTEKYMIKRDCVTGKFVPPSMRSTGCAPKERRKTDWRRLPAPKKEAVCYTTKGEALRAFKDWNQRVIDAAGGLDQEMSKGEFDSVNERYGLKGKRKVRTVAQAMETVVPSGRPFCLDQIDLDTLNETTPAREAGPFTLPDYVEEHKLYAKGAQEYERQSSEVPF